MRNHNRLLALLTAGLLALGVARGVGAAELTESVRFNIKPQALETALLEFSKQAGIQVFGPSKGVAGKKTAGLQGEQVVEEALKSLLKDSGLTYRMVNKQTVAIGPADGSLSAVSAGNGHEALQLARANAPAARADSPAGQAGEEKSDGADTSSAPGVQEIIVTATKRAERIQDVPMSIAAITADDIDRRGLIGAGDYLRGIPAVNQVEGAYGGQAIIIRGIETATSFQNNGAGPTTATYFGETPTSNSAGLLGGSNVDIKLVDIERVEVLRGPQGTAFGNSSLGGAVRTIPVAPRLDRLEAKVAAGYSVTSGEGSDNYTLQAVGNVPIVTDRFALRATAYQYEDSGFYCNRAGSDAAFRAVAVTPFGAQAFAVDDDDVGSRSVVGGRAAALLRVSDDLQLTLSYLSQKTETDGFAMANTGTFEQTFLQVAPEHVYRGKHQGLSDMDIDIANAVVDYDLGWAKVLATYSYLKGGSTLALPFPAAFALQWPASVGALEHNREHVGEIRLATQLSGAWNFLAGVYYEKQDDEDDRTFYWHGDPATNPTAPGARFLGSFLDRRDLTQKAAFGEVSWKFLPKLQLTGGVRAYEYERVRTVDQAGPFVGGARSTRDDIDASGTSFRANLSYKPVDTVLLYAGWAQGFRLGKPQSPAPSSLCDKDGDGLFDGTSASIASSGSVDSDAVDSYELGGKFQLLDRRLQIDAAVFRMDWSDIPVLVSHPSACVFGYTTNAGAARSEGVEFQANLAVTDAWRVDIGGSWIEAKLTQDVPLQGFADGDKLPGAPEVNANLGVQYEFEIGGYKAFVRADSIYVGDFYAGVLPAPNTQSGEYVKVDASAGLAIRQLNIDLFVRNLTDEDAFTQRPNTNRGLFYGYRLRPRTVGLQLRYNFQ